MPQAVVGLIVATTTVAVTAATWIDGERVTLQALDKITRISTLEVAVGLSQMFGTLEITVEKCAFHPPEEPPESAAFLTIRDIGYGNQPTKTAFAGWMFASSPAVSALEHQCTISPFWLAPPARFYRCSMRPERWWRVFDLMF